MTIAVLACRYDNLLKLTFRFILGFLLFGFGFVLMILLRSYWLCLFAEGKRAARFSSRPPSLSILGWRSTIGSGGPCSSPSPDRALVRGCSSPPTGAAGSRCRT